MNKLLNHSSTYAWLLLVFLTSITWWVSHDLTIDSEGTYRFSTIGLILLAFFKIRLIVMHFMEIKTAPLVLRLVFEAWLIIVLTAMLILYWFR